MPTPCCRRVTYSQSRTRRPASNIPRARSRGLRKS
jgi:hypothetical protein